MAVCIASDLAKDMAGTPLFEGVSFKLERRERLTLAGRNGAGKTTLLRMLAGETSIDGGQLSLQKRVKIALHDQRPPREDGVSLRDYVLRGCAEILEVEAEMARLEQAMAEGAMDEQTFDAYARAQAELERHGGYTWRDRVLGTLRGLGFAEADLDRDLGTFSGGELTRASLARALAGGPDLLLLDEPTNHLDIESLEWLEAHLQTLDAAVVLVAHDRWFLEAVGTAVLELEAGRSRFFAGTWYAWRAEKAQRELALGRAIDKQNAEIAKLERFVTRFRAGTRAKQAQSRQKQLDKIAKIGRDPRDTRELGFQFKAPERAGRVIFELEDGTVGVPGRTLLQDAEMWLERGEHVSIVGHNGAGKTTLLKVLAGDQELESGKLRRGHNVTLGLLTQHAEELDQTGSVLEAAVRATRLKPNEARSLLGRFLFSGEAAEKPVDGLSGGERRRLSLACLVASGANVLVLDEPTNHLDLESREALEAALQDFPGTVVLVSHDRALLDAVGTRTISVEDRRLRSYVGGWPEYVRVREERKALEQAPRSASGTKAANGTKAADGAKVDGAKGSGAVGSRSPAKTPAAGASKARRGRSAKVVEAEIETAERTLAQLEAELSDPAAWNDPRSAERSTREHAQAKSALEALYAEWEETAA